MGHGNRKHLWIVNHYALHDAESGGARHHNLALVMSAFETTIFCSGPDSPPPDSFADHVKIVRFRSRPKRNSGSSRLVAMIQFAMRVAVLALRRPSRVSRPDIILGSSPHPFAAAAALFLARRFRVPFVLEVRDVWPASIVELGKASAAHPMMRLLSGLERILYRGADLIVSPLDQLKLRVAESVGAAAPAVIHAPNGVQMARFDLKVSAIDIGAPFVIAYAGAHGPPNSLEDLVYAADHLPERINGRVWQIRTVGTGVAWSDLNNMAKQCRYPERIQLQGPVSRTEVPRFLQSADVLVLPGRDTDLYRYGFSPNKLAEYMASGKPVVTAIRADSNPVIASGSGMNVIGEDPAALAAAIVSILSLDSNARLEMGARGRAFAASRLAFEKIGETLERSMLELLAEA